MNKKRNRRNGGTANWKMRYHRDTIQRLSIILDDDAQRFEVYADRLENWLKARPIQKLAFIDQKFWAYNLDGVMIELYWDDATGQGVSIRMMDEENDERLRGVGRGMVEG